MKKTSKWILVDQAMINRFAEASLDPDPMHIDPEWLTLWAEASEGVAALKSK